MLSGTASAFLHNCKPDYCNPNNYESNEGPGSPDCCPRSGAGGYEECFDDTALFKKSTAHAFCIGMPEKKGTDYCAGSNTLHEAYINCEFWSCDDIQWKTVDCRDFNWCTDWEYYCTNTEVKKKKVCYEKGCDNGACKTVNSAWQYSTVSRRGDDDYCSKRKEYSCTLCIHGDYDCDYDSECSGSLDCMGPVGGRLDGCCNPGETWDDTNYRCCECSSGACCDGCQVKTYGTQPNGYTDYYECEGGANSPTDTNYVEFNDYYCGGNGVNDVRKATSNNDPCGTCEYCMDGESSCRDYSTSTRCGDVCQLCNGAGSCSRIPAGDDLCGTTDCGGWYIKSGTKGPTDTEYCYDKEDIPWQYCESLGVCNDDPNPSKCADMPAKDLVYTCGTCKYMSSVDCTNEYRGDCNNYVSGTSCGTGMECDGNGNCVSACSDDCSSGQKRCNGKYKQTCGNYDADNCLEWPSSTSGSGNDDCSDCSCSCSGYNKEESIANGNCEDGKDNDCDGKTDMEDSSCYIKYDINLNKDWNLISFPLNLKSKSIKDVFKNINFKSIFSYGSWNYYFNETNNNFNTIDESKGYWINSLNNQILTIEGTEFDNNIFNLKNGWNLIGYKNLSETKISKLLNNATVYMYNDSEWYSYNSNKPSYLNTLDSFVPGFGYWVKKKI